VSVCVFLDVSSVEVFSCGVWFVLFPVMFWFGSRHWLQSMHVYTNVTCLLLFSVTGILVVLYSI
jgi:hypothetical protein